MRKIAYVSGTRADFGLMTPVLRAIQKSRKLKLELYATGMHLMPRFGRTFDEVKKQFPAALAVPAIFSSDDRTGMARFAGDFLKKIAAIFEKRMPDIVLILGDRVEMLLTAAAALYLGVPVAHIHGGEKTLTVDEVARHAITKIAHIHFAATKESAERIRKMGEEPCRTHIVGAPALDVILNEKLPTRAELFKKLGLNPEEKIILITQYSVNEEFNDAGRQIKETLAAVKSFGLSVVAIYPNADPGGREIIKVIEKERKNPLFRIFKGLGHKDFLALEREAAVWVGNSSAAMIESSSFKTPVVNIGARQRGRQRGGNVIDVGYSRAEIKKAIAKSLYDKKYLAGFKKIKNPWGDGKTGQRVAKILEDLEINQKLLTKQIAY
ncbi:UDP-N-acetyl-D-glucosamine 2-epimerase, UDP-hydrolysing [Candidatus Giovannonibacteria bacterium RIFCSPHIGHO2_01_FULL_45_24]|uniref:UDP-N-acetyl-D-glucosamine 2-epimerase, UDP-hydrolysing n=1 Tax=Candidatus Giovannonibacteria bacterium RIFCSPLOWO2_01_FULL_46_32 TaxID=1798353 RepID=A0A1F5XGH5_9BACT|nr:MAG: UDP-N-acetyl-D-glucosamine 2-epimerase, UDP-hydrolysing [Candidatus Giovannonibacteria bacterium RIFCSPHIGHO2_01_FULL_45_24]OGF87035.1 MAG: UDP-N-acetyl-D-glucosamine 2-epimerase, UDP-hydrolysing [Candidatus Giovannonibacteria bacterium RIFCSPLOWO2_01_FULL_46_32]